ncbi:MAG TPA: efflux RND transporter periplasmic adaptor subunit [Candidatus Sulfotelmatobacter sp.]|nr:efflux RND transporter periplasmic adaptor subunit [Candidatus Sulfotelmatobacter sp.]
MKRVTKLWMGAALLALVAVYGCGGKSGDSAAAGVAQNAALLAASDVGVVTRTDLTSGVPVSGTLTPSVDVKVTAPMAELIEQVLVREGQAVSKGQLLARFRGASFEAAATSARAQLKIASDDYDRQQNLFKEGAVSKHDVESAEAAFKMAQANEAQASKKWDDANVRSPINGVVSVRSVESGDRPGDGDPMFEIVNTAEFEFEATVPSEFIPHIRVGSPVRLNVSGFPAGSVQGHVARVNAAVDAATRQVKVYVNVPNPGGRLVGGLFASGSIVTEESRQALAAPASGVRGQGDATYAMVVENGKLAKRAIKIGVRDDARDLIEILSGLKPGDSVVTGPIEGLVEGQSVQIGGKES